jgi:hypothetical protein
VACHQVVVSCFRRIGGSYVFRELPGCASFFSALAVRRSRTPWLLCPTTIQWRRSGGVVQETGCEPDVFLPAFQKGQPGDRPDFGFDLDAHARCGRSRVDVWIVAGTPYGKVSRIARVPDFPLTGDVWNSLFNSICFRRELCRHVDGKPEHQTGRSTRH